MVVAHGAVVNRVGCMLGMSACWPGGGPGGAEVRLLGFDPSVLDVVVAAGAAGGDAGGGHVPGRRRDAGYMAALVRGGAGIKVAHFVAPSLLAAVSGGGGAGSVQAVVGRRWWMGY